MTRSARRLLLAGALALLFVFGAAGCDLRENDFANDNLLTVEVIGGDFIVADAVRYGVVEETEFQGIEGLSGLNVGDRVEIEWEEGEDGRYVLYINLVEPAGEEEG